MGVYVKGMEMPKNCHSCPMCLMRFCQAWDRELSEQETRPNAKRPEDCPLIHVPEHGRLIDADALKKIVADQKHMNADIYNGRTLYSDHLCVGADYDDVCAAIDETPTVIEAEEGE